MNLQNHKIVKQSTEHMPRVLCAFQISASVRKALESGAGEVLLMTSLSVT